MTDGDIEGSPLRDNSPRSRSPSPARSRSLSGRSKSPSGSRSRSRSRSRSKSRSRSPSRSRSRERRVSRSPRIRSRSRYSDKRSRSPKGRSRSRSPRKPESLGEGTWKEKLNRIFDRGYLRRGDIEDYVLDELDKLNDDEADCVVTRLGESSFDRIKNVSGFVNGIIKRVRLDGPDRGGGKIDMLPRTVRHRVDDLIYDRKLEKDEVDQRMVRALSDMPTNLAEEALSRYARSVDSHVRSRQGFMMGIIKKIMEETRRGPSHGGGFGGGFGGSRYDDRRGYHDRGYDRYDRR